LVEADLAAVTLYCEGGRFSLENRDGGWVVLGQENLKLEPRAVSALLMSVIRIISFEQISPDSTGAEEFGLTAECSKVLLKKNDGTEITILLGSLNPSGTGHYVQKAGDPAIYLLASYISGQLLMDLNTMRDRSLPAVNPEELTYISIKGERTVEIVPYFQFDPFGSNMYPFLMTSPYKRPVGIDSEAISRGMESLLTNLMIRDFVSAETPLLTTGLDGSALRLSLGDKSGGELNLLIGKKTGDGGYYCKIPGNPEIFTLAGENLSLAFLKPFELADHFVRLINIDLVDGLSIRTPGESWEASIKRIDEETAEYFFQGKQIDEDPFKKMYQEVLYLLSEGEIPEDFSPGKALVTIEYRGTVDNPGTTRADFFEYDSDFYAIGIDSYEPEFLIGKYQVEDLLDYLRNFKGTEG
jgi:hypothetical protein